MRLCPQIVRPTGASSSSGPWLGRNAAECSIVLDDRMASPQEREDRP